jgi:hypothetical protein
LNSIIHKQLGKFQKKMETASVPFNDVTNIESVQAPAHISGRNSAVKSVTKQSRTKTPVRIETEKVTPSRIAQPSATRSTKPTPVQAPARVTPVRPVVASTSKSAFKTERVETAPVVVEHPVTSTVVEGWVDPTPVAVEEPVPVECTPPVETLVPPTEEIPVEVARVEVPVEVPVEAPVEVPPPVETVPEVAPVDVAPVETIPVDVPVETIPVEVPVEIVPVEAPVESTPIETVPIEVPVEVRPPVETTFEAPVEAPVETIPTETVRPVDVVPTETITAPVETVPVEEVSYIAPVSVEQTFETGHRREEPVEPTEEAVVEKRVDV